MVIDKDKVFFTSDPHFGHNSIIKYCNRPFMNEHEQAIVDEYLNHSFGYDEEADKEAKDKFRKLRISKESTDRMDETLVSNWNNKVPKNGSVFVIGDVGFYSQKDNNIMKRLNGKIYHIIGNHDKDMSQYGHLFEWSKHYYELKVRLSNNKKDNKKIILCHYAMRVWNGSHYGNYMLFGHSHNTLPDDPNALSIDVGVDCHNFTPLSYDDVEAIMKEKSNKAVDWNVRREFNRIAEEYWNQEITEAEFQEQSKKLGY